MRNLKDVALFKIDKKLTLFYWVSFFTLFYVLNTPGRVGLILYFLTTGTVFVFLPSCMQECLAVAAVMACISLMHYALKSEKLWILLPTILFIFVLSFSRFILVMT